MSKYSKLNYTQCVSRGKGFVEDYKNFKYDLCELTMHVCNIKIGGHLKGDVYSMKRFCKDIGFNWDTLRKWMREHRNVVKKVMDTAPNLDDRRVIRQIQYKVTSNTPSKEVKKLFKKYKSYSKDDFTLINHVLRAKGIRNFLYDFNLNKLDQGQLVEMQALLQSSLDELNKHLNVKRRTA